MKRSALISIICSMVAAVIMVIGAMLVMVGTGIFDVEQRTLVLSSSSATIIYDGQNLTDSEWHLTQGELKAGHSLSVNVSGAQRNVGISPNYISATVLDANGADVTADYNIVYEPGVLNVRSRDIVIIADSDMKLYDGEPLTSNKYKLESARSLVATDTLNVEVEGSRTEIGVEANRIKNVTITNEHGEDVTRNYNISTKDGKLIVYDDDTLVIKSEDDQKFFDGVALTNDGWEIISGALRPNHTLNVEVTGKRVAAGDAENEFTTVILDENGNDVTASYEILEVYGTLTVLPAKLTVKSNSAEKFYDGKPLTDGGYTIEAADQMPRGTEYYTSNFNFEIKITGAQTDVGVSDNTFEEDDCKVTFVEALTGTTIDLTDSFDLTFECGKLTVEDPAALTPDMDAEYFVVTSSIDDTVYLKMSSMGNYNGKGWDAAEEYGKTIGNGISAYFLPTYAISNTAGQNKPAKLEVDPVGGIFAMPYYSVADPTTKTNNDANITRGATEAYTVNYYSYNNYSGVEVSSRYSTYENNYRIYVSRSNEQYMTVDAQTREYLQKEIINKEPEFEGIKSKKDLQKIEIVAKYIQNAAEYNLKYNPELRNSDNMVIAFLRDYKEGVCEHYASAATLLFRCLDIPARYTVGFMDEVTAGEAKTITGERAHAWVEVYIDGIGWMPVEVTGGSGSGSGSGSDSDSDNNGNGPLLFNLKPKETYIEYKSVDTYEPIQKAYEEEKLTAEGYKVEDLKISLKDEYVSTPGIHVTQISNIKITDKNGVVVYEMRDESIITDTKKLKINTNPGKLQIYREELTFSNETDKITHTYDGKSVCGNESKITRFGNLSSQYSCSFTLKESGTNVGREQNRFDVIIRDSKGKDVTQEFKINKKYGEIKIIERPITITAESKNGIYPDVTSLKCERYEITPGALLQGHVIASYKANGELSMPGDCETWISDVVIMDENDKDVTKNYAISYVKGKLILD